jgi:DNA-binding transcriptional LysR family regulator
MVAVRVTGQQRAAIVAAPAYFDSHPKPGTPRDLTAHRCLRYRMGAFGPVYRWEFEKRAAHGVRLRLSSTTPSSRSGRRWMASGRLPAAYVADHIARGTLVRVLETGVAVRRLLITRAGGISRGAAGWSTPFECSPRSCGTPLPPDVVRDLEAGEHY